MITPFFPPPPKKKNNNNNKSLQKTIFWTKNEIDSEYSHHLDGPKTQQNEYK